MCTNKHKFRIEKWRWQGPNFIYQLPCAAFDNLTSLEFDNGFGIHLFVALKQTIATSIRRTPLLPGGLNSYPSHLHKRWHVQSSFIHKCGKEENTLKHHWIIWRAKAGGCLKTSFENKQNALCSHKVLFIFSLGTMKNQKSHPLSAESETQTQSTWEIKLCVIVRYQSRWAWLEALARIIWTGRSIW